MGAPPTSGVLPQPSPDTHAACGSLARPAPAGVTASTALEMVGLGRFHWQLLLVAGSGWAADGMWEEMAPLLLPQVEKEWPGVSSTVLGLLVAAQFAGMGACCCAGGSTPRPLLMLTLVACVPLPQR